MITGQLKSVNNHTLREAVYLDFAGRMSAAPTCGTDWTRYPPLIFIDQNLADKTRTLRMRFNGPFWHQCPTLATLRGLRLTTVISGECVESTLANPEYQAFVTKIILLWSAHEDNS